MPAGRRISLTVINTDPLSEEFDSTALEVEKVIAGKSQGVVHIKALDPGTYDFMGETPSGDRQGARYRRIMPTPGCPQADLHPFDNATEFDASGLPAHARAGALCSPGRARLNSPAVNAGPEHKGSRAHVQRSF